MHRSNPAAIRALPWLIAFGLAVPACGSRPPAEPAVATPEFSASRAKVALGSPIDVTYRFRVSADARLDRSYRVFVHFLDADEELMWTDDHLPPVPTTGWKPGQVVEYTRTMFVPIYPYVGEASVRMGLYTPENNRRLVLTGDDRGLREYEVGKIELLPQSENIFLIYKNGWHPAEVAPDNAAVEWQWTKREAVVSFRNPRRDATLYVSLDGRPDLFPQPQSVSVSIAGAVLDRFSVDSREQVLRRIPVQAGQFGTGDMVDLTLAVDKTFVPATTPGAGSVDARELGVRVFHLFVEPR